MTIIIEPRNRNFNKKVNFLTKSHIDLFTNDFNYLIDTYFRNRSIELTITSNFMLTVTLLPGRPRKRPETGWSSPVDIPAIPYKQNDSGG